MSVTPSLLLEGAVLPRQTGACCIGKNDCDLGGTVRTNILTNKVAHVLCRAKLWVGAGLVYPVQTSLGTANVKRPLARLTEQVVCWSTPCLCHGHVQRNVTDDEISSTKLRHVLWAPRSIQWRPACKMVGNSYDL